MKTTTLLRHAAFLLAGVSLALGAPRPLTVAVFDFESPNELLGNAGSEVAAVISATLSTEEQLMLVERTELEKVLGEQELGLSGTVDPATAARVGQWTGAKVLVTGRVFRAGDEQMLVAKIIGVETSRVFGEMVKSANAPLTDQAIQLAGQIAKKATAEREALLAKEVTRGERITAINKALGDTPRLAVQVSIPERHFGGPTFDPAVETEFGKVLTECGFALLSKTSEQKPRLEFVGEAFSEYGMRRGNLVSCKARVEVKVRDVRTGEFLAVDRQTAVAVDLSEQIAAKTALQEAALALAARVLPRAASKSQ